MCVLHACLTREVTPIISLHHTVPMSNTVAGFRLGQKGSCTEIFFLQQQIVVFLNVMAILNIKALVVYR